MKEAKISERMNLPVEEVAWGMFTGALPQGYTPESIVFVGDDGHGTLAKLAEKAYPGGKISIVERSPVKIIWLEADAAERGWSVIDGDITNPHKLAEIIKKTSGGADAVFMGHGVHLHHPASQEKVVASLFRLAKPDGFVGWGVPTLLVGSLVRPPKAFVDKTVDNGILHTTVFVGVNTLERQLRASKLAGA